MIAGQDCKTVHSTSPIEPVPPLLKADRVRQSEFVASSSHIGSDLSRIEQIVQWQRTPDFKSVGRSAFLEAIHPTRYAPNYYIRAYKIKGVGALTHEGKVIRPTRFPVRNSNPHLGFSPSGEFGPVESPSAPMGGILFERALQEYNTALSLLASGCPTIIPLLVYRYSSDSVVDGPRDRPGAAPLGVVVSGLPGASHIRADAIFKLPAHSHAISEDLTLQAWMQSLGADRDPCPRLALLTRLAGLYGKTIRKFTEAGFYRYSGAADNYSYCPDQREVYLIDLDSSLKLELVAPRKRSLEVMRDAASGIAYLLVDLTNPKHHSNFPLAEVERLNPFAAMLIGYYHDVSTDYILQLSSIVMDFYKKIYVKNQGKTVKTESETIPPVVEKMYEDAPDPVKNFGMHLSKSFVRSWISRNETFAYLMPLFWLLHQKSQIVHKYSALLSKEELLANVRQYSPDVSNAVEAAFRPYIDW